MFSLRTPSLIYHIPKSTLFPRSSRHGGCRRPSRGLYGHGQRLPPPPLHPPVLRPAHGCAQPLPGVHRGHGSARRPTAHAGRRKGDGTDCGCAHAVTVGVAQGQRGTQGRHAAAEIG